MPKYVGPFEVTALRGPVAVELQLADDYKFLHPTFHVSLVKPYTANAKGQLPEKRVVPPIKVTNGLPVYQADAILGHQSHPVAGSTSGKLRVTAYRLRWKGQSSDLDTWEPTSSVVESDELLQAYWESQGKRLLSRKRNSDVVCDFDE
jgi:Chromo (CHRromatin Organisation MOdifier) domain